MTIDPDAYSRARADASGSALSRREFLVLALVVLGAGAAGNGCGRSDPVDLSRCRQPGELPDTILDLQALLGTYFEPGDLVDVGAIGHAYIERFAGDPCAQVDDLAHTVRLVADIESVEEAVRVLEAAVVADFETDRRTSLGGWQLATTEVRLCALVALLDSARG